MEAAEEVVVDQEEVLAVAVAEALVVAVVEALVEAPPGVAAVEAQAAVVPAAQSTPVVLLGLRLRTVEAEVL